MALNGASKVTRENQPLKIMLLAVFDGMAHRKEAGLKRKNP